MKKTFLLILMSICCLAYAFANVVSDGNEVIQKITVVPTTPPSFSVSLKTNRGDWPTYDTGDSISFEFSSNQNAYILLISINKDGDLNVLLPNDYDTENYVYANSRNTLPRSGYQYQIDTYGQGTEHVLLLATRQRTDLLNRITSGFRNGSIRTIDDLSSLLRQVVPSAGNDWAQATTSYYCNYKPTSGSGSFILLSVGISRYSNLPLASPAKDAEVFSELMRNKYGFSDIVLLTDSDATKSRILNELSKIQNRVSSNQTVIFYFSGHGSQLKDDNGDEDDGLDEVLCPYDFDSADKRNSSIVDDQISVILQNLCQRAANVVFIFDSCFSGSATKALRSAMSDMRNVQFKTASQGSLGAENGKSALDLKDSSNFAFISASKGNEPSLDTYDLFGHSLFTYFMLQALKGAADYNSNGNIDTNELYRYVSDEISKLSQEYGEYMQTPVQDPLNKAIPVTK